jgi:hypothetical protein
MRSFIIPILEIWFTKLTCFHAMPNTFSKQNFMLHPYQ